MSETTQEERDHARSSWNEHPSSERGDIWKRLLNDADRLAAIERQVRELADGMDTEPVGTRLSPYDVAQRLRAIIDAPESGSEKEEI